MKTKISFVQVNYNGLGQGRNIMIVRRSLLREYKYSSDRVQKLMSVCPPDAISKFYHDRMTIQPK